jgi:hypothetical protein
MFYSDEDIYEGEWIDDKIIGIGIYKFKNGKK